MEKILKLYTYVDGTNDTPFPSADEQVIIGSFTYTANRMGSAPQITATVMHRLCLDDLWNDKVYAEFNGEKYFVINTPSSSKSNDDTRYEHELELLSEREILNHVYFIDAVQGDGNTDVYKSNSTSVLFYGNIQQFVIRLNSSLSYSGLDYTAVIDEGISSEDKQVSFEDKYILEALQEEFNIFEIPYYFVGKVIHFGYTSGSITKVLKYGYDDALLSISKENANYQVINRITGSGSSDNIPYYYPNPSPKGFISAKAGETNIGVKDKNIIMSDPVSFSSINAIKPIEYETTESERTKIQRILRYDDGTSYTQDFPNTGNVTIEFEGYGYVDIPLELNYVYKIINGNEITLAPSLNIAGTEVNALDLYIEKIVRVSKTGTEHEPSSSTLKTFTFTGLSKDKEYTFKFYMKVKHPVDFTVIFDVNTVERNFWSYDDEEVELSDYGLSIQDGTTPSVGDTIRLNVDHYIPVSQNLMPSIYRETKGAQRFYNAKNNTYTNEEGEYYEFENEFSVNNIREGITSFDDIKPSIVEMENASGQRIDMFSEFAYDTDDNDEIDAETNEYLHPYFFAKLRKFDGEYGFNLFEHAIEQQAMQISFTSGICGACTFEIGVGKDTGKNTVQVSESGALMRDENGDVVISGEPQDRQNDTQNYEVWIALKKDDTTYPQIMPNKNYNYKPSTDDTFVILGINLPHAYVLKAEDELEKSLVKHMWMNNVEKFTFSTKFSRIFFTEHPEVLAQLNENARVIIEYNGKQHTLYIGNYSYKMDASSPLPEIDVDLVDTLTIGKNSLQTQLDSVKQDILSSIGGGDFLKQGLKYFLRKDQADGTNFLLKFGEFIDSMSAGAGAGIFPDGRGQFEKIEVRSALLVLELIYNRIQAMEGDYSFSTSGTIETVTQEADGTYTLKMRRRWEHDFTAFREHDIIYGIVNDLASDSGEYYASWLRVLSVSTVANTLSVTLYPDAEVPGGVNHAPEPLMVVTQRGNPVDETRQGWWYLSAAERCLCMLEGVTKPVLEEDNYYVIIGRLKHLSLFDNLPVNYLHSYVFCRGIIANDIQRVNFQGTLPRVANNRGAWSLAVAQGEEPYNAGRQADTGTGLVEMYDTVWHYGCEWMCLSTGTTDEPKYGAQGWAMVQGNPAFSIDIDSSNDWYFDADKFNTTLSVVGTLYNQDVTDSILDQDVQWTRDTGNVTEDNAWATAHAEAGKSIDLTVDDLGPDYLTLTGCKFIAKAVLRDGQTELEAHDFWSF